MRLWSSEGRWRVGGALLLLLHAGCISVPGSIAPTTAHSSALTAESAPRTLVVALDAVPYDSAVAAFDARPDLFSGYQRPVPVISSFPSTTTLAFTGMFEGVGLATPPGYEAKFFDRETGTVRGGGLVSYGKIEFSWREFFDWKTEGVLRKAVGYARPLTFSRAEFRRGVRAFLESAEPTFYLYVGATDGVAHLAGPDAFVEVLADLASVLEEARRYEPDFRTVMLSDHGVGGGEPLINVRRAAIAAARGAGFDVRGRLRGVDDLVLVPFGLLSSFVAFTADSEVVRATQALADAEGIGLCVGRTGNDVGADGAAQERFLLASREGEAWLDRREDKEIFWRYVARSGDPLQILPWTSASSSGSGEPRWLADDELLRFTAARRFPDAAHRIARSFDLVVHRASVVCSTAPGFMFGAALTEVSGRLGVGRLRWTHGALERDDSLGFAATDFGSSKDLAGPTGAVRFDQLLQRLGLDRPEHWPSRLRARAQPPN